MYEIIKENVFLNKIEKDCHGKQDYYKVKQYLVQEFKKIWIENDKKKIHLLGYLFNFRKSKPILF